MVVASSVSGAKHTSAKWVCQIMVNLVRHTECLAACNDLLEVEPFSKKNVNQLYQRVFSSTLFGRVVGGGSSYCHDNVYIIYLGN